MAFRAIFGAIIALLFSASISADTLKINPSHPDQYIVVKGDTLWDISGRFLQKPWKWPQLWENNPQIKNPHWIYPGDILTFSYVDGKPRLSLSRNVKLSPSIRETSLEEAIKLIPADAITQFLTSPKVVNEDDLANSPYVIDFAGEHLIAGAGDRIYVRSITDPQSLSYTVYRQGKPYTRPVTGEILGYEAIYIADTTLQTAGDPATLSVNKSTSEIRIGDRLMVSDAGELALNYFPHPPLEEISGSIISVLNGVSQIGQHNIVVIDRGTDDGIETGHIFEIYQRGRIVADHYHDIDETTTVKLPDEIAGVLMVFRPFEKVSYALVMEATAAIHVLDKVKTP
ncbi:LysM peptidoglycan-binding domain-containing protein [Methylomarinum vadi]|uniref:LysM peptidoglycan-binding domain-containing protein n=1 Tax=Methylomarinum vadi TaxID=438855 RepID=UPI0004DF35F1|nr:LysM peptidoglycan-binding domain-containing protein [Methylomarinum vadi]